MFQLHAYLLVSVYIWEKWDIKPMFMKLNPWLLCFWAFLFQNAAVIGSYIEFYFIF